MKYTGLYLCYTYGFRKDVTQIQWGIRLALLLKLTRHEISAINEKNELDEINEITERGGIPSFIFFFIRSADASHHQPRKPSLAKKAKEANLAEKGLAGSYRFFAYFAFFVIPLSLQGISPSAAIKGAYQE